MNADLIIKYAYALSNIKTAERTIIIFKFSDNDKAYEIIKAANMQAMILEKLGERKAA